MHTFKHQKNDMSCWNLKTHTVPDFTLWKHTSKRFSLPTNTQPWVVCKDLSQVGETDISKQPQSRRTGQKHSRLVPAPKHQICKTKLRQKPWGRLEWTYRRLTAVLPVSRNSTLTGMTFPTEFPSRSCISDKQLKGKKNEKTVCGYRVFIYIYIYGTPPPKIYLFWFFTGIYVVLQQVRAFPQNLIFEEGDIYVYIVSPPKPTFCLEPSPSLPKKRFPYMYHFFLFSLWKNRYFS